MSVVVHQPPDLLKAQRAGYTIRNVELEFDLPRVGDLADYIYREREDRLKTLRNNHDIIVDDTIKMRLLIDFSTLNLESMFRMVATLHGQAWLVNRCYVKANPEIKEDYELSSILSIGEVREVFSHLCSLTGLIGNPTPREGPEVKEEE